MDGSKIVLPDRPAVRNTFGTIAWTNGKTDHIQGERPYALASVLYDILNWVALDATLTPAKAHEINLAAPIYLRYDGVTCWSWIAIIRLIGCSPN